jgi:hypothetical protein
MIAALLYKEYREHRSIWLALALLAAGLLVGVPQAFEPEGWHRETFRQMLAGTAALLAWTYGLVCGAMMLAGERESGTQAFLDTLPTTRRPLWLGKCLVGLLFVALHIGLLAGMAGAQGFYLQKYPIASAAILVGAGLAGFGWGLLFSSLTSNVLSAIGLAILAQMTVLPAMWGSFFILASFAILVLHKPPLSFPPIAPEMALVLTGLTALLAPLPLSALIYSRFDRKRQPVRLLAGTRTPTWRPNWRQIWWLAAQQSGGLFVGLILFSFLAGLPVMGNGLFFWPVLTLALGVFCGVTVFLDEQSGPYRFLGDQRLPLGPIWLVKTGMRFGMLGLSLLVVLVPALVQQTFEGPNDHERMPVLARIFGTGLLGTTIPIGLFLFLWPITGFALGHLCGMLFPRPLVALVVGFGISGIVLSVWVPSLVAGGLSSWQVLGVPVVLLLCARLLMRAWASDRLHSWEAVRYVGACAVLAAGLIVLGLWSRVAEIPDVPEPDDFAEFVAELPLPEENEAGQLIRNACSRLDDFLKQHKAIQQRPGGGAPGAPPVQASNSLIQQAAEALEHGWPKDDDRAELAAFLDEAFAEDWWKRLAEAADKPVGVVEDPRRMTIGSRQLTLSPALHAGTLLAARGLQMQKRKGDPAVFVEHFATALALARNLHNHSTLTSAFTARAIEQGQLEALTRWLEQLNNGHVELLRRAAEVLDRHQNIMPRTFRDQRLAQYLIALNSLDRVEEWLPLFLGPPSAKVPEAALLDAAWLVPWEQTRQRRLLRALYWNREFADGFWHERSRMIMVPLMHRDVALGKDKFPRRKVQLAAAELMLALRRFQAEHGKPAQSLAELLPKYLQRIPSDPFDSQPFRYRLSQGEEIGWPQDNQAQAVVAGGAGAAAPGAAPAAMPPGLRGMAGGPPGGGVPPEAAPPEAFREPTRKVPAGQGILWSIGEDGQDDGGKRQGLRSDQTQTRTGEDLIYLVPLPAPKRQ